MTYCLIIRSLAEADILVAFDWYEEQRPGLGIEFMSEVESALGRIVNNPER